jgi:hypothetical protein
MAAGCVSADDLANKSGTLTKTKWALIEPLNLIGFNLNFQPYANELRFVGHQATPLSSPHDAAQ